MFLNRLVKHATDIPLLAEQLRALLRLPVNPVAAGKRMRAFVSYLRGDSDASSARASAARMNAGQPIQPARVVFFASMWWHMRESSVWPAFHTATRRALQTCERLYVPTGDAIADYLRFRDVHMAVSRSLGLDPWQLDYLCRWLEQRGTGSTDETEWPLPYVARRPLVQSVIRERSVRGRSVRGRSVRGRSVRGPGARERGYPDAASRQRAPASPVSSGSAAGQAASAHTHVQWLLASLGRMLGCSVWIAANDRSREWRGERLASLSMDRLPPLALDPESQRLMSLIDVVWLRRRNHVAAAFEVEHTTAIYSGLLRLADLAASAPNLSFPLYVVAPETRLPKVRRELTRPAFRALGMDRRCAYFFHRVAHARGRRDDALGE